MDCDGIIDPLFYGKNSCKVCWVLKEANNKGNGPLNIIEYLHYFPVNDRVARRIALISANINGESDLNPYSDNVKKQLLTIAWININKEGGGSKSSYNNIKKYFESNESLLFSQLKAMEPEIVIFGGTFSFFWNSLVNQGCLMQKLNFTEKDVLPYCYIDASQKYPFLFVEVYHPAYLGMKDIEYVNYVCKAIHTWKTKKWKLIDQWQPQFANSKTHRIDA